ncbi:serine/threonine-protein kinase [Microlunatus ginsengisoli]|uniref:serine/threonine-protein kinase n=1 Tax=Microlunatus ginsengisoli TaxID=363863 RepID=UPI0031DA38D6
MGTRPPDIAGLTEWHPLARGGFAMVWQARQATLNRLVAVKVDERRLDTESERQRFLREAGAAGRMSGHAGIVTVHDAGILPDDRPYLVMELCPGGSLNTWVKREGRPSEAAVVEVGTRIAGALAAAHARGVIHRDVKPANILIDAYGQAGLADFGLAALPEPDAPPTEALEALTPAYAPPEVLAGEPATEAGDVYALAATLYALMAAHSPHWNEPGVPTPAEIAARRGEPIERVADVTPALMDVLLAGLADDPADRPTAAEFAERLAGAGRAADAAPVGTASATVPGGRDQPGARQRNWVVLAAVGVIVLGVMAAWLVAGRTPGSGAATPPRGATNPARSAATPAGTAAPGSSTGRAAARTSPASAPTALPTGFVDCTARAGAPAFCPAEPECWTSVFSYMDSPYQAVAQSCSKAHVYQTFAAVRLDSQPRRKSQLNAAPEVKAACTRAVANRLLRGVEVDGSWEVMAIPPQFEHDTVYRCIAGKGTRTGALELRPS